MHEAPSERVSRSARPLDGAQQPLDIADRLMMLKRRTAGTSKRPERTTTNSLAIVEEPSLLAADQGPSSSTRPSTSRSAAQTLSAAQSNQTPQSIHPSSPPGPSRRRQPPRNHSPERFRVADPGAASDDEDFVRHLPPASSSASRNPMPSGRLFDPNDPGSATTANNMSNSRLTIPNATSALSRTQHRPSGGDMDVLSETSSSNIPARRAIPRHHQSSSALAASAAYASGSSPMVTQGVRGSGAMSSLSAAPPPARQLFDPSKDDPMRFSRAHVVQHSAKGSSHPIHPHHPHMPQSQNGSSMLSGYNSSTATSDTRSMASSAFTLSSNTTSGTSVDSGAGSLGDGQAKSSNVSINSTPYIAELKRRYREICTIEEKIKIESLALDQAFDADEGRDFAMVGDAALNSSESLPRIWIKLTETHKSLAEADRNLLTLATNPNVPASVQMIPEKYNIPERLWRIGFHQMIVTLRRASVPSSSCSSTTAEAALEILVEFIYHAYKLYTELYEERNLEKYRGKWLEALGDLANYRMAVAVLAANNAVAAVPTIVTPAPLVASTLDASSARVTGSLAMPVESSAGAALSTRPPSANAEAALTQSHPSNSSNVPLHPNADQEAQPIVRRIQSPVPSVGPAAAAALGDLDERIQWRDQARTWYSLGLKDTPGAGRLQHHLGTLCVGLPRSAAEEDDAEGEELRGAYHFVKSMITLHPFDGGREALLNFFSPDRQQSLASPTASACSLFLHIYGLLFTRIDLDRVKPLLARFIERLQLDGPSAEESEWTMMAVLSVAALLEFGKKDGHVRNAMGLDKEEASTDASSSSTQKASQSRPTIVSRKDEDSQMASADDDPSHLSRRMSGLMSRAPSPPGGSQDPRQKQSDLLFSLAIEVAFTTLGYLIKSNAYMPASSVPDHVNAKPPLNPFITTLLTFVGTTFRSTSVLNMMEKYVPWGDLASLLSGALLRHGSSSAAPGPRASSDAGRLSNGQLLPEDWCIRGMEWAGRRVYERGFWKAKGPLASVQGELDVIMGTAKHAEPQQDGIVEDDDQMDVDSTSFLNPVQVLGAVRWKRLRSVAEMLIGSVSGFDWNAGANSIVIVGDLADKIALWEQQRLDEEQERELARQALFQRSIPSNGEGMDLDGQDEDVEEDEDDEEDSNDTEHVKELKARRKYLRSLLANSTAPAPQLSRPRHPAKSRLPTRPPLQARAGYTVLVIDTNILLSSLSVIAGLVNSNRWTIVIPLAVITELDGISRNDSPLGNAARDALTYLEHAVPRHHTSLKVQTSKGNYLRNLSVRSENVEFGQGSQHDRNMDDLILRSASWQDDHFVYRGTDQAPSSTCKVVLLSFDRNLRLKARSRKLDAADEKEMGAIIAESS